MIAVMTTFIVVKEAVLVLRMWRNSLYNKPDVDDICALKWGLHHSVKFRSLIGKTSSSLHIRLPTVFINNP